MAELTIIAGCNGSGKSTFAPSFLKEGLTSFDYDKLYLQLYSSLHDCEFREEMARNMTSKIFEEEVKRHCPINWIFVMRRILMLILSIGQRYSKTMAIR
jgi:predicted ABC-type ATPase